jgi:mono/diheme cytochrome c family protein
MGAALLLGIAAMGCLPWGRGTYQVELFSEMHYTQAYRSQEPPRLYTPPGAVPFVLVGSAPLMVEAAVSVARTAQTVALGEKLYGVNCVVCHGALGKGDGPMKEFLLLWGGIPPADITGGTASGSSDDDIFSFVSEGGRIGALVASTGAASPSTMPIFRKLLNQQDLWALVHYVRALQGQ